MSAFHQTVAQVPAASGPLWQRLHHCPFCQGYTSIRHENRAGRRLTCGHLLMHLTPANDAAARSNVAYISVAPFDLPAVNLPLVESPIAKAGFASPAADYVEDGIDLNALMVANAAATFFVRVSGDSMADVGIFENDIVTVDRSINPTERSIVVAVFEGSFYIKRLLRLGGQLALCAENASRLDDYPPMLLREDPDHVIWGVVTGAVRKF